MLDNTGLLQGCYRVNFPDLCSNNKYIYFSNSKPISSIGYFKFKAFFNPVIYPHSHNGIEQGNTTTWTTFNPLTADDQYIGHLIEHVCKRYVDFPQNYEKRTGRGKNLLQSGILNFKFTLLQSSIINCITKLEFTMVKNRIFKKGF